MTQQSPEPFTPETLAVYLAGRGLVHDAAAVRAEVLTGGVSNLAFWVDVTRPEGDDRPPQLVVKQARGKLAVQMEWLADVRRILREAEAMGWLYERLGPPHIPELLDLDRPGLVMVMEAIPAPAENYKARLLRGVVELPLAEQFGELLARMHNATRDDATRQAFGDATFFDQLRLSPYWDTVAERHPTLAPRLGALRRQCLEETHCLVHGDYSPKNALVRDGTLVLLDYEVAHFGNPSFDLGFVLTHYLCKALHLRGQGPACIAAARGFWQRYQATCELPPATRAEAGHHLAATMLARMDGKSPLEYFTDEGNKETVRRLTTRILLGDETGIDAVIAAVEREL